MPYADPEKRREAARNSQSRRRARKHAEKYGPEAGNMCGRHGNHARGPSHGRWTRDRLITSHGYVAVRVPIDHPHGWGPPGLVSFKYAYEHVVTMMERLGRPLRDDEVVHHRNGDKADNRHENLELMTRSAHSAEHARLAAREIGDSA